MSQNSDPVKGGDKFDWGKKHPESIQWKRKREKMFYNSHNIHKSFLKANKRNKKKGMRLSQKRYINGQKMEKNFP